MSERSIYLLEVEDGKEFTYPVDSPHALHAIAEGLKHHQGDKPLSPTIRGMGEVLHNLSSLMMKEIQDTVKETPMGEH